MRTPTRRPGRPLSATTAPTAPAALTQDQQRQRRRTWLRVHYTGSFDLSAEIAAITAPLAEQITALPYPPSLREEIDTLCDAVHEVLSVVVGMLAESRHLGPDARSRTARAIADLAQRPREPQITDAQITAGSWPAILGTHVAPYSADLSAFLARALPPRTPCLTGPSASERLEAALRVLDSAALATATRIPKVAARQRLGSVADFNAAAKARRDAERADTALVRLRVTP